MPDVYILKPHQLGLERARHLVNGWITEAEKNLGLHCSLSRGDLSDSVTFQKPGVKGVLNVSHDQFELLIELGFLFKGFRQKIAASIESKLEELSRAC